MTDTSRWYQTLDSEKRKAVRSLHEVKPLWNMVGFLFILMWMVTGIIVTRYPHWLVSYFGYISIGLLIHGMANLMHEGTHGNLFRKPNWDRGFGFVMGAPSLFSVTAYRVTHTLHHKHNRGEKDPDEFTNITKNKRLLSVAFYVWFFVGMFIYLFHVPLTAILRGKPKERMAIFFEYGILMAIYATVVSLAIRFHFLEVVCNCWLIPLLVAAGFGNIRSWAEHMLTLPGHPLTETRTVTSNPIFSFLNINLNYHLEHHLYPGMPWYNLPKLHNLFMDEYQAAGSSIYSSYLSFLRDAFRAGVHGVAPVTTFPS